MSTRSERVDRQIEAANSERGPRVDGRGGGGNDGGMDDERLRKVEQAVIEIKAILPTLATKTELSDLKGEMRAGFSELKAHFQEVNAGISRWLLGTVLTIIATMVIGLGGLALTTYNALKPTPSTTATSTQPPIVINIPSAAPPTNVAPQR